MQSIGDSIKEFLVSKTFEEIPLSRKRCLQPEYEMHLGGLFGENYSIIILFYFSFIFFFEKRTLFVLLQEIHLINHSVIQQNLVWTSTEFRRPIQWEKAGPKDRL